MKVDYNYHVEEASIRRYRSIPEIDRLRWLEELCELTNMFRQAPVVASEPLFAAAPASAASSNQRPPRA